ncbi:MAG TPA: 1-acyl-sn-glycerol-3-phosphate acyltransferase [Thermoanaerobaculia bacterium]|nr:1-acyl-sn-glycerol-3-phosphate acyltransferase [Thermoanaerobaculia bacterium]
MKLTVEFVLLVAVIAAVAATAFWGKRHARRLQRARRIRIDRFKLKRRHADIELEVFGSRELVQAVQAYAREHHVSTEVAMKQAKTYLREIVPKFNLLAYYRFGAPLARAILYFLYRVVVERKPIHEFNERLPKGAVIVYVINHRSNADYVLVAHMLFKFISLSYAVGEWARVWPLNHLFKWFGGYFVRRRYREPLYHAVLSKFVQTITRNGVTQGIFIEGGLTRDGAFLKPKLGMLDYLVTSKRDPDFTVPLYLVPTSVNYDRVLEDRNLTEELLGREDRSSKFQKLRTSLEFLFKNTFRSLIRRFKRYGYAMVTFGEPVSVDAWVAEHPALLAARFEERKAALQQLAETVMTQISNALPITPVTLIARILADHGGDAVPEEALIAAIERYRSEWHHRVWLLREHDGAGILRAAREVLELRHLIEQTDGGWRWNPAQRLIRDYYANALLTFEEVKRRGWPERGGRSVNIPIVRPVET